MRIGWVINDDLFKYIVMRYSFIDKLNSALRSLHEDKIPGGLSSGMPDSAFDPVQLRAGIKVELEHTSDRAVAKEIAKDHLKEDPKYYIKLRKMEAK